MYLPNQVGLDYEADSKLEKTSSPSDYQNVDRMNLKKESIHFGWSKHEADHQLQGSKTGFLPQEIEIKDLREQEGARNTAPNLHQDQEREGSRTKFPEIKAANEGENKNSMVLDGPRTSTSELKVLNGTDIVGTISFTKNQRFQEVSSEVKPEFKGSNVIVSNSNQIESHSREKRVVEEPNEEVCCRICLETEQNDTVGQLIVPCQCTGSMKLIHDECLKTWIISKADDVENVSCELCNTKFNMKFTYKLKCYPNMACKEGIVSFFSCICLTLIVVGLLAVTIYFAVNWNMDSTASNSDSSPPVSSLVTFKLSLIVICSVIACILFVIVIITFREACFVVELDKWDILPPDLTKLLSNQDDENQEPDQSLRPQARRTNNFDSARADLVQSDSPNDRSIQIDISNPEQRLGERNIVPLLNRTSFGNESNQHITINNSRVSGLPSTLRRASPEGSELQASFQLEKQNKNESKIDCDTSIHVIQLDAPANLQSSHPETSFIGKVSSCSQKEMNNVSPLLKQKMNSVEYEDIMNNIQNNPGKRNSFYEGDVVPAWQKSPSLIRSQKNISELRSSLETKLLRENLGKGAFLFQNIPKEFRESQNSAGGQKIEVLVDGTQKKVLSKNKGSEKSLFRQFSLSSNSSKNNLGQSGIYKISNDLAKSISNRSLASKNPYLKQ